MAKSNSAFAIALLLFVTLNIVALTNCTTTSTPIQESTGEYIDSSTITMKVKSQLLTEPTLKNVAISVETYKGVVQLRGFVNNKFQRQKVIEIARSVAGVVSVRDSLIIKKHVTK